MTSMDPGKITIKEAMSKYGLTDTQAKALNRADGNQNDTFIDIVGLSKNCELSIPYSNKTGQMDVGQFLRQCLKMTSAQEADDSDGETLPSINNAKTAETSSTEDASPIVTPEEEAMQNIADLALEYYLEHNSFEGMGGMGFPNGVKMDMSGGTPFDLNVGFEDSTNDIFKFKNQKMTIMRFADSLTVTIAFEANGKSYKVKSTCPDLYAYFTEGSEDEAGRKKYNTFINNHIKYEIQGDGQNENQATNGNTANKPQFGA